MDSGATVVECVVLLVNSWVSLEGYCNGNNVSRRVLVVLGDRGYKIIRPVCRGNNFTDSGLIAS